MAASGDMASCRSEQCAAEEPVKEPLDFYKDRSALSIVTVSWLTPLLKAGYARPLDASDLPLICTEFSAETLRIHLDAAWSARVARGATMSKWCLFYALFEAFGRAFVFAGLLKFIGDICALTSPFVLRAIIANVNSMEVARQWADIYPGLLLCGLLFSLQMVNTVAGNTHFILTRQGGLCVRTATTALIYQKSLRLSSKARQEFTTGKIVNLLSSDTERLGSAPPYLHYIWSGPFQIIVIVVLLFRLLGWAALVGVAFLVIIIPIQSKIMGKMSGYREETSATTDRRVRLMQEIIQSIRIIKFYAWELCFLDRLDELREKELGCFKRTLSIRTLTIVLTVLASTFSCIVTFVIFFTLGNELTLEVIFPTLALFALISFPLFLLPEVVTMAVDGAVAVKRIQRFLLADELDFFPIVLSDLLSTAGDDKTASLGLLVSKGSFVWESAVSQSVRSPVANKMVAPREAKEARFVKNEARERLRGEMVECTKPSLAQEKSVPSDLSIQRNSNFLSGDASSSVQESRHFEEGESIALNDINISIKRGALVAIFGPVGSGKSSLLNALVGELKALCSDAVVQFGGRVAYCSQQAWIQNGTVRENILFGRPYEGNLYRRIVKACALVSDFEMLPDGDSTEIGEKGVNMSGGQKQRISLARAAYSNGQVFLLDDPLSAVDAHVGRHLFKHCINGVMKGTTRILVTHQIYLLPKFDHIIMMNGGSIAAQGSFEELMHSTPAFKVLMRLHGEIDREDDDGEAGDGECGSMSHFQVQLPPERSPFEDGMSPSPVCTTLPLIACSKVAATDLESSDQNDGNYSKGGEGKITRAEERLVGSVSGRVYKEYIMAAGGLFFAILSIVSAILLNGSRIGADLWVTQWTGGMSYFEVSKTAKVVVYLLLGALQGLFSAANGTTFAFGSVSASRTLHSRAVRRLLSAPVAFFDTNPTGRIMSRFSRDLDTLDNLLVETIRSCTHTLAVIFATYLTLIIVNWVLAIPLALLIPFYLFFQSYYRKSSRELKRIESLARSPMYAQFSETLTGLSTIRAFGQQEAFQRRSLCLMDDYNSAAFVQLSLQRWLSLRLEVVGNIILLGVSSFCYLFPIHPTLTGLIIQYTVSVSVTVMWCLRQIAELETQIISAERLSYYANQLAVERKDMLCSGSVVYVEKGRAGASDESLLTGTTTNIPLRKISCGQIEMRSVTIRYRPELEPVLLDVSISVGSGERIGIVGRTGAGKSSIMLALFRIVTPSSGAIFIDSIDTAAMALPDLRSSISIIPQDPVVFATTVRWNLDPHGRFTDDQLWCALDRAHLRQAVQHMDGGLDAMIQEGGENLSVGQRQLLCLARAILCDNRILVLDEATANVDMETDALIQESIRRDFGGATILTIAHRIKTVIDYDRILVLDKGRVVEFDSPRALLADTGSLFYSLASEESHIDTEKASGEDQA